jgi:hypothetical protein
MAKHNYSKVFGTGLGTWEEETPRAQLFSREEGPSAGWAILTKPVIVSLSLPCSKGKRARRPDNLYPPLGKNVGRVHSGPHPGSIYCCKLPGSHSC